MIGCRMKETYLNQGLLLVHHRMYCCSCSRRRFGSISNLLLVGLGVRWCTSEKQRVTENVGNIPPFSSPYTNSCIQPDTLHENCWMEEYHTVVIRSGMCESVKYTLNFPYSISFIPRHCEFNWRWVNVCQAFICSVRTCVFKGCNRMINKADLSICLFNGTCSEKTQHTFNTTTHVTLSKHPRTILAEYRI